MEIMDEAVRPDRTYWEKLTAPRIVSDCVLELARLRDEDGDKSAERELRKIRRAYRSVA